ncbi:nucleoside diphosphate kinase B [Planoprotostelium fungivorum]|uniref:nucleoside-diphosphate kinase n=1 Tax=Planoprotostelium fungivorum TaxID=1890364 RepID=A0A2P6NK45_9EUKA|nr:nucleoside diphosphate kinase B [Planoprotostelium fungivorum]
MFANAARLTRVQSRGFSTVAKTQPSGLLRKCVVAGVAAGAVGTALYLNSNKNTESNLVSKFTNNFAIATVEAAETSSVPHYGAAGTQKERTFIAIKPDGVNRGLIADIIARFEKKGFKLVGLKLVHPTEDFAAEHYDDLKARPFFPALVKYFASGPVVAMVWEGKDVILTGRKLIGATNPADAAVGTIRGDYCIIMGRNIIHGSDGADSAKHEISLWFKENEIADWESAVHKWTYEK